MSPRNDPRSPSPNARSQSNGRDALPTSYAGKLLRRLLREQAAP